ncbi:7298_t:CDS:2 [Entrophospora sp. SA101]|nr:7298_t:CDS:2 [Entrophospora sp. SA101]
MDREFGTRSQLFTENKKSVGTRLDFSLAKVSNQIIVDAEITSFDNFANEIKRKDQNFNYHFSRLEVEKLYNLLCFQELKNQDDEEAKYNPAIYYPIIVNQLSKKNDYLKSAINKALKEFRKKYEIEIKAKEEKEVFDLNRKREEVYKVLRIASQCYLMTQAKLWKKTRGEVYLLDTKSGITAKSQETVDKSNALQN